ncbi:MAG: RibD family protein, partial [Myxococcota bacterium]
GEVARQRGHALRNRLDAIAVGVGTVLADDPSLTCRIEDGRDPIRVVLDTHGRTPVDAKIVSLALESSAPTWILVGEEAPESRIEKLKESGVEIVRCATRDGRLWLDDVLVRLGERDVLSLLVEGGPSVLGAFRDRNLLNKMFIFMAPKLIGGKDSLSSVGAVGADHLNEASDLEVVDTEWLGDDLMLTAYPKEIS